jgi:hypothetical protein
LIVPGKAISYPAAYSDFKAMLKFGGLDPKLHGLHSPRSGATTEAFHLGIEPHIIDLKGRWRSLNTKFHYLKLSHAAIVEKSRKAIPY